MGVPAFYRWLLEKYPKTVEDVLEERVELVGGQGSIRVPFDATKPNPSGIETDNLYIDMNGIIHPCSHPENGPQPKNEQEMYENVCLYVDRLTRAARPRRLLYLAIDGVAPRAKMNQQRSRRFRSAQEARERAATEVELREGWEDEGTLAPPPSEKPWDSNVITPGTKFMIDLSEYIRFYIRKRIATDKAWQQIKVIFSDASVPGEGEHKIMAHIRQQRGQKGYNPNLVHAVHGLDADLIMLALATHEAHFYILREEVLFGRKSIQATERKREASGFALKQKLLDEAVGAEAMELPENANKPLQRLSAPILREYLANEFASVMNPPFKGEVSFERLVDDIVFLCFFVGNDFLPHLPSLDIRDGALDYLFNVYRRLLPGLGGYLTDHGGVVHLDRVDVILAEVGAIEDYVFEMKHKNEENSKSRRAYNKKIKGSGNKLPIGKIMNAPQEVFQKKGRAARLIADKEAGTIEKGRASDVKLQRGYAAKDELRNKLKRKTSTEDNAKAADALKQMLSSNGPQVDVTNGDKGENTAATKKKALRYSNSDMKDADDMFGDSGSGSENEFSVVNEKDEATTEETKQTTKEEVEAAKTKMKEKLKDMERAKLDDYAKNVVDNVKLHQPGWKDRYYTDKCKADDVKNHGGREHLFRSYVVGLCWVMKYYYAGCPSWKWYYPFHYGPFASDLRNIERFQKDVESLQLDAPFKPVEQLLSVLPEDSSHAVPKAARLLMRDDKSPIIDFYPKDVPCDPNGKAMPWLWVVLLPFINEDRLLAALLPTMKKWTSKELLCNSRGMDDGYVFLHHDHPMSKDTAFIFDSKEKYSSNKFHLTGNIAKASCFCGFLRQPLSNEIVQVDSAVPLPATSVNISRTSDLFSDPIESNQSLCFAFTEPTIKCHRSVILRGAVLPRSVLTNEDRRIRRPRLNFGGDSIANLGGSNNSHKSGHGSMNISSYERDLARQKGRGSQMNQAGTRQWGSLEPVPKRLREGQYSAPPQQTPTIQRWHAAPPAFPPPPPLQNWHPPPVHHNQQYSHGMHQNVAYNTHAGEYNQQAMTAMTNNGYNHMSQQEQWHGNNSYPNQSQQHQNHTQQQNYGHPLGNYQLNQHRGHTINQQGQHHQMQHQQRHPQQTQHSYSFNRQTNQQPSGQANLNNLRAQLMSTLQRQRKGN